MAHDIYKFELNMATPANYLISGVTGSTVYTDEQLARYAEYIKRVAQSLDGKHWTLVSVYGGNAPLECLDQIAAFFALLEGYIDHFSISMNAMFTEAQFGKLLELYRRYDTRFMVKVHCDDSVSLDGNIDFETYGSFWFNVRRLAARGMLHTFTARVSGNTIARLPEIYTGFSKMLELGVHKRTGNMHLYLSLNEHAYTEYDETAAVLAIESCRLAMLEYPEAASRFFYKVSKDYLSQKFAGSLMGNCFACMCSGGVLYPGYEVPAMSDIALENFAIGNISEDIEELLLRRDVLLKDNSGAPVQLEGCAALFASLPWDAETEDGESYTVQPFPAICDLHQKMIDVFPVEYA